MKQDLGFKFNKETFDKFRESTGLGVAFNGNEEDLIERIIKAAVKKVRTKRLLAML